MMTTQTQNGAREVPAEDLDQVAGGYAKIEFGTSVAGKPAKTASVETPQKASGLSTFEEMW